MNRLHPEAVDIGQLFIKIIHLVKHFSMRIAC